MDMVKCITAVGMRGSGDARIARDEGAHFSIGVVAPSIVVPAGGSLAPP